MNKPTKVFVAEDDQGILEVISIILNDNGYLVKTIEHAEKVLSEVEEEQPDLIIMDIWLFGKDGGEIVKQIKKKKSISQIPIVMLSANNEIKKIAKNVGAQDFLAKPFNITDLIEIIKKNLPTNLN